MNINSFPPELLSEIFLRALPPGDFEESVSCALTLSRVCSFWYTVSTTTPRLWTSITVRTREGRLYPPPSVVQGWLERSGTCPLSWDFRHTRLPLSHSPNRDRDAEPSTHPVATPVPVVDESQLSAFGDIISLHNTRCHSLRFTSQSGSHTCAILGPIMERIIHRGGMPNLKILHLGVPLYPIPSLSITIMNSSCLEEMVIEGNVRAVCAQTPFRDLKVLKLNVMMPLDKLLACLNQCPALEDLTLRFHRTIELSQSHHSSQTQQSQSHPQRPTTRMISLPRVHTLKLTSRYTPAHFFDNVHMPGLKHLFFEMTMTKDRGLSSLASLPSPTLLASLPTLPPFPSLPSSSTPSSYGSYSPLTALLARSHPKLEKMELSAGVSSEDFIRFLQLSQGLRRFAVTLKLTKEILEALAATTSSSADGGRVTEGTEEGEELADLTPTPVLAPTLEHMTWKSSYVGNWEEVLEGLVRMIHSRCGRRAHKGVGVGNNSGGGALHLIELENLGEKERSDVWVHPVMRGWCEAGLVRLK